MTPLSPTPCRLPVEVHVQPGEAAVLRGAGAPEPTTPGALPGLQVQAAAQEDLHRGGPPAEGGRVQGHDEEPQAGAEDALHPQVGTHSLTYTHTHT